MVEIYPNNALIIDILKVSKLTAVKINAKSQFFGVLRLRPREKK
jgi:hypothetical protein